MISVRHHELPDELEPVRRRVLGLEWITIAFRVTVVVLMYLVMGSSQAMRVAFVEDALGFVSPIVVLLADKVRRRRPSEAFPYGYHRAVTVAFLIGAVAVLGVGCLLVIESAMTLLRAEHPTIGGVRVLGRTIWLGWLMILVLVYTSIPAMVLGWMKLRPARQLHDKAVHTDAAMNKADWFTGLAAIAGVVGIGYGWWWADAGAALAISVSVLHDGWSNTRGAFADLMDRRPHRVDRPEPLDLPAKLRDSLRELPWVKDVAVRLREAGHVLQGEVYIVPVDERDPLDRSLQAAEHCYDFNWRVQDVAVQLVHDLDELENRPRESKDASR